MSKENKKKIVLSGYIDALFDEGYFAHFREYKQEDLQRILADCDGKSVRITIEVLGDAPPKEPDRQRGYTEKQETVQ